MAMLPELHAEEQLAAIEAASVPHFKQEHANAVIRRHQRTLKGAEARPQGLHEALIAAGISVIEVPKAVKKRV